MNQQPIQKHECLECFGSYYKETIRGGPKGDILILETDARDDRFCSKWCEKAYYNKQYEKQKGIQQ